MDDDKKRKRAIRKQEERNWQIYHSITWLNNSVPAELLNNENWLRIIRDILRTCGKFLEESLAREAYDRNKKTLGKYVFDFLLPKSTDEKRFISSDFRQNVECHPFFMELDTICIFGKKISEGEMEEGKFFEQWFLITIKGWMLWVEIFFERQLKKEKSFSGAYGYEEIVTAASFYSESSVRGDCNKELREKIIPHLDSKIAREIIQGTFDILNLDRDRRQREADEFKKAYDFYEMVCRRIDF